MRKAHIVCVHSGPLLPKLHSAMVERFSDRFAVVSLDTPDKLSEHLDSLQGQGQEVALVAIAEKWRKQYAEDLGYLEAEYPRAVSLSLPDGETTGLDGSILNIIDLIRSRLRTYDLRCQLERQKEALEIRNKQLESLNDVGTAMAGSFDIGFILEQIHRAVSRLVGHIPTDVFYAGNLSINARPRWYPPEGSAETGHLDANQRDKLQERVSLLAESLRVASSDPADDTRLEPALEGFHRIAIPIAHKQELLGLVLFKSVAPPSPETARFLSILTLQAATALRNIHLTQERIQFERLAAFGRMIGSLVHDFRSPLTAVRGYAGMLSRDKVPAEERETYGGYLLEECDRLNGMIGELLEFTRGRQSALSLSEFNIGEYLKTFPARVAAQHGDREIRVRLELNDLNGLNKLSGPAAPDGQLYLFGDRQRLDRAFWNVTNNACQAMSKGGQLIIRTRQLAGRLVLEFEDTGPGIPAGIRHRIFEPFFSYGKSEGIGLGMSITQRIVEEHDGNIELLDGATGGTRVRFSLPLTKKPNPALERAQQLERVTE